MYEIDEYQKHECKERMSFHKDDIELGDALGEYPEDCDIFKISNDWFMNVAEFHVPIRVCPFCGVILS